MSIDDELNRNREVSTVIEKWMRADANAARQWISTTSDLSDAQKSHYLDRFP